MKRNYSFIAMAALLVLATGCKKEQQLVTLGAYINQPTKTYIDGNRYPCWNADDQIFINNAVYTVSSVNGSSAQIDDVVFANAYRAVFPASIMLTNNSIAGNSSVQVFLPSTQTYVVENGHQRVDAPMGAFLTSGSTLQFNNLCSIVHVVVNNAMSSDLTLSSIELKTTNARLSGSGVATVEGSASDCISMDANSLHNVTLSIPDYETVSPQGTAAFDIIVPPFPADNVTIAVTTDNGHYFGITKSNVALVHNTITTVTLNVNSLNDPTVAAKISSDLQIPYYATAVVFEYNSTVTTGTVLSTYDSPVPIYGNMVGRTWTISTSASTIDAPTDCSFMFMYKTRLRTIDFGSGFNTANVTNMFQMFNGCTNLQHLNISCFNTSNVTTMNGMFSGASFTSLDVSNFNTSNVTDMDEMFGGCSNLTSLDVSNFNTAKVTNMTSMFGYWWGDYSCCNNLTSINLSNFVTTNVTDMSYMFGGCSSLTSLDVSSFNTSNVRDMTQMFVGCESLTNLNLSNFNTSNVILMSGMFSGCNGLTNLYLSNFDMGIVDEKENMCENLSTTSGACTITCPLAVENAIKEQNSDGNYITNLPTSGVTFTWVRP